jgi:hypothetical protein
MNTSNYYAGRFKGPVSTYILSNLVYLPSADRRRPIIIEYIVGHRQK